MIILLRSLSSNHALGGESVLLQNSIYEFALRRTNDALRPKQVELVLSEVVRRITSRHVVTCTVSSRTVV